MGGFGSGRRGGRPTVESAPRFDIVLASLYDRAGRADEPEALHALFGRIGARAKMQFPIHPHMLRHGCAMLGSPLPSRKITA
jgi:integrase